jgi:TonB family protein
MRRGFTLVSIVVHAIVVAGALVAQVLAIGPLPTPRQPLTFEGALLVRIADIRLPNPSRHAARGGDSLQTPAVDAAPIDAPSGIRHETELESAGAMSTNMPGVESGLGTSAGIGIVERIPPPPPQPADPPKPVRLHSGMQPPRKIVDVRPVYSPLAQSARKEGVVILEAVLDAHGHVASVHVLRSIPLLDQAAVEAVRQWVFTPTLLNDVPVPVVMTVTVNFTLQDR